MRELLAAKIHNATVTEANLAYIGSITIDASLLEAVDLWPGQKVLVVSNTSGARLETYIIQGDPDSGTVCMNGACAHRVQQGEQVIIMGFQYAEAPIAPRIVLVDDGNRIERYL